MSTLYDLASARVNLLLPITCRTRPLPNPNPSPCVMPPCPGAFDHRSVCFAPRQYGLLLCVCCGDGLVMMWEGDRPLAPNNWCLNVKFKVRGGQGGMFYQFKVGAGGQGGMFYQYKGRCGPCGMDHVGGRGPQLHLSCTPVAWRRPLQLATPSACFSVILVRS